MSMMHFKCNAITDNASVLVTCNILNYALAFSGTFFLIGISGFFIITLVLQRRTFYANTRGRDRHIHRSGLWWLSGLFLKDIPHVSKQLDLFGMGDDIKSSRLRDRIVLNWDERKSGKHALILTLLSSILVPFLQIIPPRTAWIAFSYSQTWLIAAAVDFLENPFYQRDIVYSYVLIGATTLVYIGITISYTIMQGKCNRMLAIFRASTVSLIYETALRYPSIEDKMPAATLISSDTAQLSNALVYASEVWAISIEVAIGLGLLWRQIGPAALAPVVLTAMSAGFNTVLARLQIRHRRVWIQAVQRRVGLTSAVLGSMKSVKLGGMSDVCARSLQDEQVRGIDKANKFRWFTIWQNTVAEIPIALSSLLIFAVYAVQVKLGYSKPLSTVKAYTSLALISILSQPCSTLIQAISAVFSVSSSIKGLEEYLKKADFDDDRRPTHQSSKEFDASNVMILLENLVLNIPTESGPILMNLRIMKHTITMLSGPIGSGKSSLLRVLLGEMAVKSGRASVHGYPIAYCAADPWLRNVTIKENIIGDQEWDDQWYQMVIHICDLAIDFRLLPQGDDTSVGSRGGTLSGGQKHRVALARALYSRHTLLLLDETFSALDGQTKEAVIGRVLTHVRKHGLTLVFVSHDDHLARIADHVLVFDKHESMVTLQTSTSWLISKIKASEKMTRDDPKAMNSPASEETQSIKTSTGFEDNGIKSTKLDKSSDVWIYYLKSIGLVPCLELLVFTSISVLAATFPRLWLKDTNRSSTSLAFFISIYTLAAVLEGSGMTAMLWASMIKIASTSSIRLHQVLVHTTFNAPMSYFDSTDNSVTLNRFTQDMMLIERALPIMTYIMLQSVITYIVQLILITLGSKYMAATVLPILFILYLIQRFYLRTSRKMRSLNLEAESPLYQQFTETTEGIATIRAFGSQEWFRREFLLQLDQSQRPFYLLLCMEQWLSLVLNIVVGVTAVILIALACLSRTSTSGNLGIALTTILTVNTQLQRLISAWIRTESSLGSVARIKEYEGTTPNENVWRREHLEKLDDLWPRGAIDVQSVTVEYQKKNNRHIVLDNVSFVVKAGQKLGICGRTGSGKSTLLSVLLRLVDPRSGRVFIDGIDISNISRDAVRTRLICIPQDPLLLPGTIESNLNVDGLSTAAQMQSVLEVVQLWDIVKNRGGLKAELQVDSLSHGERQLIAIARAILRNRQCERRSILILDEASNNLDSTMAALVQQVIQKEFKSQTVISIAHRREALEDCDVVIELAKGRVTQTGLPGNGSGF